MPVELGDLVAPQTTALVTVEVQEGVVGEHSIVPELASAADAILPRIAALAHAARGAGARVVHCTAESRGDGQGSNHNTPLLAAMAKRAPTAAAGASIRRAVVHSSIGATDTDLVMARVHGLSPMTSTSLDPVLRNLGITTIVATGVSVNVAVLGFAFEAVNLGYQLVVPRDAVAGVDAAYVDAVFERTLRLLATITTTDAVIRAWMSS
jgi:nicotinamidase-related amidase